MLYRHAALIRLLPLVLVIALVLPVAACSGGGPTGSVSTTQTTPTTQPTTSTTGTTPTPAATQAPTAAPTPTPVPIASCSQVSGFGSAGSVSTGAHFSEVGFPANTVGFIKQTFETNNYQFEILSACTKSTTVGNIQAYFATGLPGVGFAKSTTFPYQGNPSSACGDPYCWFNATAHPSFEAGRYISLEAVTGIGSVVTYNLRLSIAPLERTATINASTEYDFDLVSNPDVNWSVTGPVRQMTPENGASVANIGVTNFTNVTAAQVKALSFGTTPIDGNADPGNKLVPGDVWAVHTDLGAWVKVLVTGYNVSNISVQYVLYQYTF
jgi:hypothetical protein